MYREGRQIWYCIYCKGDTVYSSDVTTNFRRHLHTKHSIEVFPESSPLKIEIAEQFQKLWRRVKEEGRTEEIGNEIFEKYLDQEVVNEALVSLIVVRNLPSRVVEWPEFHALCLALNPQASTKLKTAHSTIPQLIQTSFQVSKDIVRRKLQSAISRIHLSLDIWTSPNQYLFLSIVGHFVDNKEKRQQALLALRTVANHTSEEQANILFPVLQDYDIVRYLGIIMGDNASNNDALCRTISTRLQNEGIPWDNSQERLRCLGHIINLVVQAFLFQNYFEIEDLKSYDQNEQELGLDSEQRQNQANTFRLLGPLGKLHNIVVHTRSSTHRTNEFLSLATRKIPLDNRTRWNSWYKMIVVALEVEAAVDRYTKAHLHDLQEDFLTPENWTRLRTIMKFLQPFHRATLSTEGYHSTLNKVLFTMDTLVKVFKISQVCYFLYEKTFILTRY